MQTANKTINEFNSISEKLNKELLDLAIPINPDTKTQKRTNSHSQKMDGLELEISALLTKREE